MADIADELGVTESRISQLRAEALSLLKDGMNTHLDPELAPVVEDPTSIVARRRASYYSNIQGGTSLHSRLALTTVHGHRVAA
jgi:RNA polymerase sigma factor for flagellar operon FliA